MLIPRPLAVFFAKARHGFIAARESEAYPRLFNMFGKQRPLPRFNPLRLRYLSRTIYARRAINAIKDPIKQMPWEIRPKKGVKMNSEIRRQIAAATSCFELPNYEDTFMSFCEQIVEDILAVSAGVYEQQETTDPSRPLMMWPVDGQSIQIIPSWTGSPLDDHYVQIAGAMGSAAATTSQEAKFADREMVYIKPNPSTETPYGYGPLEMAARSISRQLGASEFAGNVASNATPSGILWPGKISTLELRRLREYWKNEIEGQGTTPIFGGQEPPQFVGLGTQTDDALYLKWQQFLLHEMATAFGLHVMNFNPTMNVTGDLGKFAENQDWQHAIRPTAKKVQSHFTVDTLNRRMGFYSLEFMFDGLDREDEKELAEIYKIYYQNNLTTPNDFRTRKLGIEAGDNKWMDCTYGDMQMAIGHARRGTEDGKADLLDDPDEVKNKEAAPNRTYPGRG